MLWLKQKLQISEKFSLNVVLSEPVILGDMTIISQTLTFALFCYSTYNLAEYYTKDSCNNSYLPELILQWLLKEPHLSEYRV